MFAGRARSTFGEDEISCKLDRIIELLEELIEEKSNE